MTFDTFQSEFVLNVNQRYLAPAAYDLSSIKKEPQQPTSLTTQGIYFDSDQLEENKIELLKLRSKIYNSWFLRFRKSKLDAIATLDKKIDELEDQMISLNKEECNAILLRAELALSKANILINRR